ncbi:hypothetical protein M413DRAFT_20826 [Hebeloma cylindrosporum]|uniref:Uncharacterized protein n=1 Tax=Hebeloma cylindrosporum TaxID=76867 RepID=A0A0C3BUJ1_HEBCY|nr:hypothetical protein M413DRAFT_20826 [Hebeloma cylindrosporum h7]
MSRAPYPGSSRKLVLAFDVGTTYSGISYSILDPGMVPSIKAVTRFAFLHPYFPSGGGSKIPTVMWYDRNGNVRAAGAEATRDNIEEEAADGQWVKAEWFKLHLRAKLDIDQTLIENIPPLPLDKTIVQLFADFLKYLLECASHYIQVSEVNGVNLWASVEKDIDFVLSHPNGWDGKEQEKLRTAAVLGGLIPDTSDGHARISFVSEGEASLHFIIQRGELSTNLKNGEGILIVDAGGGTIDLSAYRQRSQDVNTSFEEIAAPQCLFYGSVTVNLHAKVFLQNVLKDSPFVNELDHIVHCFDKMTKMRFKDKDGSQYIKFGGARDNDAELNIRAGRSSWKVRIIQAVLEQRSTSRNNIIHVVFVGGFAASDWLYEQVSSLVNRVDSALNFVRPEEQLNKAVSDGAVSFYLDHFVRTRISKATYGTVCSITYDPRDKEHQKRAATKFRALSGEMRIPDIFYTVLSKDTQVSETMEFRGPFNQKLAKKADFRTFSSPVWSYRGPLPEPKWKDVDPANYTRLCNIEADLSHLPLTPLRGSHGGTYYRIDYDVVLLFGLTELKAMIAWEEEVSPAKIIYDKAAR